MPVCRPVFVVGCVGCVIPAYPSEVLSAAADERYPAASSTTLESMRTEPRRSAGGVRGMKLRTWGLALRRIEDFAAEAGGEAALFDRLCEFVTGGGYITDLCGKYAVDREVLLAWIRKDRERDRRWKQAEADRKDGQREEVLALWSDVMAAAPVMAPEWKDVLKASEMMARHSSVLRDGPGNVTVNAGAGSLIAILSGIDETPALPSERPVIDVTPQVVPPTPSRTVPELV